MPHSSASHFFFVVVYLDGREELCAFSCLDIGKRRCTSHEKEGEKSQPHLYIALMMRKLARHVCSKQ